MGISMKRKYSVICVFFLSFLALSLMCYGSYRYAEHRSVQERKERKSRQTSGKKKNKITSRTKYIIEKYDEESEELVKEERMMPPEYIGLNRSQLQDQLAKEMATISREEEKNGLISITLQSFSDEQIVVRNTYSEKNEKGFVLKLMDGEVAIFSGDGKTLYEKTGIMEQNLAEEDCELLRKGYVIQNEKELYSILENFSS